VSAISNLSLPGSVPSVVRHASDLMVMLSCVLQCRM
jgi:Asp-tRNA(Asn)/Glu-tRNA(Gln) amidotransferase B subunit